ncbi:MAG: cell surface protein [Planctomycetota bacterium]|nr:cell surface protein [Planctomycetota bacterium]
MNAKSIAPWIVFAAALHALFSTAELVRGHDRVQLEDAASRSTTRPIKSNCDENPKQSTDEKVDEEDDDQPTPFADRVVMFRPGPGGGKGKDDIDKLVLGPPQGAGKLQAGQHVVSLGRGGVIVLEFVDNEIFDGEGADFIVFENPFLRAPGDNPNEGFFELAKVEVSSDGENWIEFPYDTATRKGCAGHRPVLANAKENKISPTDPEKAGGDPFDLKDVGLKMIRFVRISDVLGYGGADDTSGFDLDAGAGVHSRARAGKMR